MTPLDSMLDNPQNWDDIALSISRGLLLHFISFVLVALSNKFWNNNISFSWLRRVLEERALSDWIKNINIDATLGFFYLRSSNSYAAFLF